MTIQRPPTHDSTTLAITDHIAGLLDEGGSMYQPDQRLGIAGVDVSQDQFTGELVLNVAGRRFYVVLHEIL